MRGLSRYWPLVAVAVIAILRIRSDVALLAGLIAAFIVQGRTAWFDAARLKRWQTNLLQLCVVGLGFGIPLGSVLEVGQSQFWVTVVSISGTLLVGMGLGGVFGLSVKGSYLVAAGTAICGGSAIAALSPIVKPKQDELALSLAVVFLLNSVALIAFPPLGHLAHLTQNQFGLWSALAIHDTSSVVGAASRYGNEALLVATTVKLMRALWILPLALITAWFVTYWASQAKDRAIQAKPAFPWFILGFVAATVFTTAFMDDIPTYLEATSTFARRLLAGVLFLIGLQLPLKSLKGVGVRTLGAATALWVIVSMASYIYVGSTFSF